MILSRALFLSDLHLGWIPVLDNHERLLLHLPAAVADAPHIILNGDIIDTYRVTASPRAADLIARFIDLMDRFRREGREVIYIEGNHDTQEEARGPFRPDRWFQDCETKDGRRVRILHGHRFTDDPGPLGAYERIGRRFLRKENELYATSRISRTLYPFAAGWVVGAIGLTEDRTWRPGLVDRVSRWDFDHVVHGHYHYGPGEIRLPRATLHRTGAWVSAGHLGTVDRILRYQGGRFERLALTGSRWVATADGR